MSFPIRRLPLLPSPLHQRCWPSPPASDLGDDGELIPSASTDGRLRSPSLSGERYSPHDRRRSASFDTAYFPLVTNVPASNDSFASVTLNCPQTQISSARVALAWAIVRLRHPILASIGLMDAFGKVSYSYDPPTDVAAALYDAEASLEMRKNTSPTELLSSYKTGTRRVSRSHLSHLFFSTSPSTTLVSPPPTPPLHHHPSPAKNVLEFSFLVCSPHYVADNVALASYIDELVTLLNRSDLDALLEEEWKVAASKLSPAITLKPASPVALKMKLPREGRFLRTVAAS